MISITTSCSAQIYRALYNTSIGKIAIYHAGDSIATIKITDIDIAITENIRTRVSNNLFNQLNEYFDGKRREFDATLLLRSTEFQEKVWRTLLTIPYGETRTYKDIAEVIENPRAYRAVGMANNKNPLPIVIPCHRVIGSKHNLVGYRGGLNMKRTLLNIEGISIY